MGGEAVGGDVGEGGLEDGEFCGGVRGLGGVGGGVVESAGEATVGWVG